MNNKKKVAFLALTILAGCFLSSVVIRRVHEEFVVDDCLSGHHGSFDYSKMSCDLETNHPYVPYGVRHPRDGRNFALALSAFVAFLLAYGRSMARRRQS